ncbi:unnamed protein product, partial [Adineta steineri]
MAEKIRQNTTEYKYTGNLSKDAKCLGINVVQLNECLTAKASVTTIARNIFKKIVPENKRTVSCWDDLPEEVLLKEQMLIKFLKDYFGPLEVDSKKVHTSLCGCLRNDRRKQNKLKQRAEIVLNNDKDSSHQEEINYVDDDDEISMRPTTTLLKKKEAVKRKNHGHWFTHKHQIKTKRNMRTLQLDQSQILSFNEHHTRISTINDGSDYLSANKITDDLNTELLHDNLDDDFLNEYAHEVDDDGIAFYDASDDFHCNEDEEINEKNDEGEDTLTEEQMNYADEFINMGASSIPIRQYDELDISVILLMIKKKHKCTNSLVNDILKLLIALKVPRIPTSW